jgi:hypothetical protein
MSPVLSVLQPSLSPQSPINWLQPVAWSGCQAFAGSLLARQGGTPVCAAAAIWCTHYLLLPYGVPII